jgi:hypothetical protein
MYNRNTTEGHYVVSEGPVRNCRCLGPMGSDDGRLRRRERPGGRVIVDPTLDGYQIKPYGRRRFLTFSLQYQFFIPS